jgi:hypothetical protein
MFLDARSRTGTTGLGIRYLLIFMTGTLADRSISGMSLPGESIGRMAEPNTSTYMSEMTGLETCTCAITRFGKSIAEAVSPIFRQQKQNTATMGNGMVGMTPDK